MPNKKIMKRKTMRKKKEVNPKIYYSSTEVRALSNDGGINDEKRHENLTSHDIMDILSHPASKKDLRTRLLEDFDIHRGDHVDEIGEMQKTRKVRKVRNRK